MVDGRILRNVKRKISTAVLLISMKFGTPMCIGSPNSTDYWKFEILKNQGGCGGHLEINKSRYIQRHLDDVDKIFFIVPHISLPKLSSC